MSHARDNLDALLPRVQVMELKFDDREPMRFDVIQEGTLKRLSMALDIDLAAHEARIRAAKVEALKELRDHLASMGVEPWNRLGPAIRATQSHIDHFGGGDDA